MNSKLPKWSLVIWFCLLAPASPALVHVSATPPRLLEGFTEHMTLTCDLHNDATFTYIHSMILSKTTAQYPNNYTEIASITHLQPLVVNVRDHLSAHVYGAMTSDEVNITYTWVYPPTEASGQYSCSVFGMDSLGHPIQAQGVVTVEEAEFGFDMILNKLRDMEISQSALQSRLNRTEARLNDSIAELNMSNQELNATKAHLDTTEAKLLATSQELNVTKMGLVDTNTKLTNTNQNLTLTMTELDKTNQILNMTKTEIEIMKEQRNNLKSAITVASTTYNNHEYILTKPQWEGQLLANLQCQIFGGYLAEFNDKSEFEFLNGFLKGNVTKTHYTYVSGIDHSTEDKWLSTHSGEPLTFLKWCTGEPNGKVGENCNGIDLRDGNYCMIDLPCHNYSSDTRFLCEIPL